ncbi:glycoside hydrolase family 3 N-terminal domain-containing protein [Treponema primitia]|uniref:glycoside hydrolase family 3 N-terminal domain-containing protein n=1 Tax=Treponema primitia TaxID=88058 RepID=UPI0002555937|nr:glycoside hydrolase family 3 N-terminal domain-containing protein [Treponema primitia]
MRSLLYPMAFLLLISLPLCTAEETLPEGADPLRVRAGRIAAAMDDRTLAGQVLLTGLDGNGTLGEAMRSLLRDISPGGVMLFKMNLNMEKGRIPGFLKTVSDLAATSAFEHTDMEVMIPPFMAVDHEGGIVHRFVAGVERLPPPLSYWELAQKNGRDAALRAIEKDAVRSGTEIRALGINLNLAPVAEILNSENAAFLEDRSYGSDTAFVEAAAAAFVRGMGSAGVACVVKHFPGNSGTDPHQAASVLRDDRETLDKMVLPFVELIAKEQPAGIMVSHVLVNAWDDGVNASRSRAVVSVWLRENLGFRGIVLGDDFSMGAISAAGLREEDAVIEALNAGVDMVMTWPRSLGRVHRAILRALGDGRLKRERLEEAAARIIYEKIRYGLME